MTHLAEHTRLALPILPPACRHGIGLAAAERLTVNIKAYTGMDEGDLVELFWDGCYVTCRTIGRAEVGQAVSLSVPSSFVLEGVARIHYQVMQVGRSAISSAVLRVPVKLSCPGGLPVGEENQGLTPLIIPEPIRRHGVNPNQMRRGLPLSLAPYPNMAAGDEITLLWGDVRFDLPKLVSSDIGRTISVFVPAAVIQEAGEDSALDMTYCVIDRVGNNSRWAPSRRLRIGRNRHYVRVPRSQLQASFQPWRE